MYHAHVATAKMFDEISDAPDLLVVFQILATCPFSWRKTQLMSQNSQILHYLQLTCFKLHFELLTNGVECLAGLLHVVCDAIHLVQ